MKIFVKIFLLVMLFVGCIQKDKSFDLKPDELIRMGGGNFGSGGNEAIYYLNKTNQICYLELLCNGKVIKDELANKARYSMVIFASNINAVGKEIPHLCGVEEIKKIKQKLEYWLFIHIDQYKIGDPLKFYSAMADKSFPPEQYSSFYSLLQEEHSVKLIVEKLEEGLAFRKKVGNKFVDDIQNKYWKDMKNNYPVVK